MVGVRRAAEHVNLSQGGQDMKKQGSEKKEIRALGRMLAHELSNEDLERIQGSLCATAVGGGSSCGAGDFLRDLGP